MDFVAKLKAFRQTAYNYLSLARDATFELTDAVLLTRNAYCLADLSLCPCQNQITFPFDTTDLLPTLCLVIAF